MRGRDYVLELEPHDDVEKTVAIVRDAHPHGWTITDKGYIAGLVAGDMGYATTSMRLDDETLQIFKAGAKALGI